MDRTERTGGPELAPPLGLDAWRGLGRSVEHDGRRVFVAEAGDRSAPALLCLHGFPTSSWDYRAVLPVLATRYRVILPDLHGYGWTDKPRRAEYSIPLQADLVDRLLSELGVARCLVLAHDYGDTVLQELLARRLEQPACRPTLEAVVLLNGGLFPEAHRPRPIQRLLAGPCGSVVSRLLTERRFRTSFSRVFGPDSQPSESDLAGAWALITHDRGHRLSHRLIGYIREREENRDRWVGALQRTPVPLRFVDGLLDPVSGASMVRRYRELVPSPDVVELPDVGHYPQLEAPVAVLDAALDHFDRAPSTPVGR